METGQSENGKVMNRRVVVLWSVAVGAMDFVTGCLLVTAPAGTLVLMRVPVPGEEALPFLSWVGVFVGMVGASYLLGLWRRSGISLAMVWHLTAWFRAAVAVFVFASISTGRLDAEWWLVGLTDMVIAVVQWVGLRRQWMGVDQG
jgi:hypothetical protein